MSTYDFSTLLTTFPHNLIKEKLIELIEQTFNREGSLCLACNENHAFSISGQHKQYKLWSYQKMCDTFHYLLDNLFIKFGTKVYRQIVGTPMDTNCASLDADLVLFCYERDFMLSLSDNNQTDIIEAFNSTSRNLNGLFNLDDPYFEQIVGQIYTTELQLNKANSSDTEYERQRGSGIDTIKYHTCPRIPKGKVTNQNKHHKKEPRSTVFGLGLVYNEWHSLI